MPVSAGRFLRGYGRGATTRVHPDVRSTLQLVALDHEHSLASLVPADQAGHLHSFVDEMNELGTLSRGIHNDGVIHCGDPHGDDFAACRPLGHENLALERDAALRSARGEGCEYDQHNQDGPSEQRSHLRVTRSSEAHDSADVGSSCQV